MNMLRDPPTFREVAKIFIVGITLRSYLVDNASCSDGRQQQSRTTCLGHEMSRRISMALCGLTDHHLLARRSASSRRRIWLMSPERLKDYDANYKKRAAEKQLQLNQNVQQSTASVGQ